MQASVMIPQELLPHALASRLQNFFDLVAIAEEEIAAAIQRYPQQAVALWDQFKMLSPSAALSRLTSQVYRAHCRELLERVAAGEDTRPATLAEILVTVSDESLAYAFNALGVGVYAHCWRAVWAGAPNPIADDQLAEMEAAARSQYGRDEIAAEIAALRRKLAEPARRLRPPAEWRTPPGLPNAEPAIDGQYCLLLEAA